MIGSEGRYQEVSDDLRKLEACYRGLLRIRNRFAGFWGFSGVSGLCSGFEVDSGVFRGVFDTALELSESFRSPIKSFTTFLEGL